MARAQSSVVGVTLLVGLTVVSIAALTAGAGSVLQSGVAATNADRVASDAHDAVADAAARTGPGEARLSFSSGSIRTASRTVRIVNATRTLATFRADALVYAVGERRVVASAGSVARGASGGATLTRTPAIAVREDVLLVGLPALNATSTTAVGGDGSVTLRTNTTHERLAFPSGEYRLAVETSVPTAWESFFAARGVPTTRRDFDGDGVESVVATVPGRVRAHVVVHDLRLEVVA